MLFLSFLDAYIETKVLNRGINKKRTRSIHNNYREGF
jgi:hypothetical protein